MSDLQRLQDAFMEADRRAQAGDEQARRDAQLFAQELRRLQAGGGARAPQADANNRFMGQVNAGIADVIGGGIDLLNPFDANSPIPLTGSARDGMVNMMDSANIRVADQAPETVMQGAGRGLGQAAAALIPVAKALQGLRSVGGAVGSAADEAYQVIATRLGITTEAAAGALSGGAEQAVENAGGPEWMQSTAAILAPASIAVAAPAARAGVSMAEKLPVAGFAVRAGRDVARGLAPMTETGARLNASERLQQLVGGGGRAEELARGIDPNDPLGRTPAQQTADPNLIGLENSAARENPLIREDLNAREAVTRSRAQGEIAAMGGDVRDARQYFAQRLSDFRASLSERVDRAMSTAQTTTEATANRRGESINSVTVNRQLKQELETQLLEERRLWEAVPRDDLVGTANARAAFQRLDEELPRAQANDMPNVARQLLGDEGGFADAESVNELHGLYSELRRIARVAGAGPTPNENLRRVANTIADAILEDLGAIDAATPAGQAINEARAFSRALNETFDQGPVGRILQRTRQGDDQMLPETALRSTVGRSGPTGAVSARDIEQAAPQTTTAIQDYVRQRFVENAIDATGKLTRSSAARWMRDNAELLQQYPGLRAEFQRALQSQEMAERFAARAEVRSRLAESGPVAEFNSGQPEKAVFSILGADNPVQAAESLVRTARRDTSGKAMAGLKGAFSDYLIGKANTAEGLSGTRLKALLGDPNTRAAMSRVFSAEELRSLNKIADALATVDVKGAEVGEVLNSPAQKIVEMVARWMAVNAVSGAGNNVGSQLQFANMASGNARTFLERLTNDRARRLLMDAVTDPELMKTLLMGSPGLNVKRVQDRLAPYLVGGSAAALTPDE